MELLEANFNIHEAREAAKADPDFLGGIAMPEVFGYCWPPVFRSIWEVLVTYAHANKDEDEDWVEKAFAKIAIGLPRGFGKTTVIKLFVLYCILFTDRKFILVFSATAGHARNIISDVCDMLNEPNIRAIFGDWRLGLEKDTQDIKKFGFLGRNIILAGIGAGGSVRGLNLKHSRPDVMLFEDVQTREDADSKTVSEALEQWMIGTAMKAKSPSGCLTIFIANMYPTPYSILKKLVDNPEWIKFIAGGILADGTSLWEDLQPLEQLLAEYRADLASGHPEIFYAEVLNDPNASVNTLVDFSSIKEYAYLDDDIAIGKFVIIDPSNDKINSDAVAIGYFEMYEAGIPCAIEIVEERFSPLETIKEALSLCEKHNCQVIAVESNAYQYSLLFWFDHVATQIGLEGIHFVEVYSGRRSKNSRILDMFKQYSGGDIQVHPNVRSLVHDQMASFRPLKTDNVDNILDLLTYAPKVIEKYGALITAYTVVAEQTRNYENSVPAPVTSLSSF